MKNVRRSGPGATEDSVGRPRRPRSRRGSLTASLLAARPAGDDEGPPSVDGVTDEMLYALQALVTSAHAFRSAFVGLAEGCPIDELLDEHGPTLELADRVVESWAAHWGSGSTRRTGAAR